MITQIYSIIEKALKGAKITDFELYFERQVHRSYEVKDQALEASKEAVQVGLGLRVFHENRFSFVYSTDLREEALHSLAEKAVQLLPLIDPDEDYGLPPSTGMISPLDLQDFDSTLDSVSPTEKIGVALGMEAAAKNWDPRIKHVRSACYEEEGTHLELVNSRGRHGSYDKTLCSLGVMAVAEEGEEAESSYEFDFSPFFNKLNPEKVGEAASRRALDYLGGKIPATGQVPVVLDPLVVAEIMEVWIQSFKGDEIFKGRSSLKNKLEEKVYSKDLRLIDDPRMLGGVGSLPFDGEGEVSQRKVLVEGGVIKNFFLDHYYGKKMRLIPNASLLREGIFRPPFISYFNLSIPPGVKSDEEIFREIGSGIWVTEVIGMHAANPITGEFSVGIQGFLIEGGQKSSPIKQAALAGNLHQMMKDISLIGSNHRFSFDVGAPTLAIRKMVVSGS